MEILIGITKELESEGMLRHPMVWLEPGLGPELAGKLGEAVRKMGGTVADHPGEQRLEFLHDGHANRAIDWSLLSVVSV